jgi:putative heme iron utilization protein
MEIYKGHLKDESVARLAAIHRAFEGLENKETFTVQEAANLLLASPIAIRQAVRRGDMKGLIINHRVIWISREALLDWLRRT